jgi:flagellar L-ring protein precursor FlgH
MKQMTVSIKTKRLVGLSLFMTMSMLTSGCATIEGPKPGDNENFAPVTPVVPASQQQYNGAIYQRGTGMSLFTDNKARQVGDVLTVVLTERTNASKSANTSTEKESELNLLDPTVFGAPVTLNGQPVLNTSVNSSNSFDGAGSSSQSNQLSGYISVTVAEVMANGNLRVQGEKWLQLNQGREYVRLRGVVRLKDVEPNNTVDSTKVANAEISYGGTGAVNDANTQGWLGRFFNSKVWPF